MLGMMESKCFWFNWIYSAFVRSSPSLSRYIVQFPTNFDDCTLSICCDRNSQWRFFSYSLVSSSIYEIANPKSIYFRLHRAHFTFVQCLINLLFTLCVYVCVMLLLLLEVVWHIDCTVSYHIAQCTMFNHLVFRSALLHSLCQKQ